MFKVNGVVLESFLLTFEHISHIALVFLLLTLNRQMSTGKGFMNALKAFIRSFEAP